MFGLLPLASHNQIYRAPQLNISIHYYLPIYLLFYSIVPKPIYIPLHISTYAFISRMIPSSILTSLILLLSLPSRVSVNVSRQRPATFDGLLGMTFAMSTIQCPCSPGHQRLLERLLYLRDLRLVSNVQHSAYRLCLLCRLSSRTSSEHLWEHLYLPQ